MRYLFCLFVLIFMILPGLVNEKTFAQDSGEIQATVTDAESGKSLRARVYITDWSGKPVFDTDGIPFFRETSTDSAEQHFTTRSGTFKVAVPTGTTHIRIYRGPEYTPVYDTVNVKAGETVRKKYTLKRWINMAKRGWYSGDFHIHRPLKDMKDLVLAEDLNVALPQTYWNARSDSLLDEYIKKSDKNGVIYADPSHLFTVVGEEIERYGGAILLTNLGKTVIPFENLSVRVPTDVSLIRKTHELGGYVDIEKPFWREAIVNAAVGKADFIEVVHNHINRLGSLNSPAWGWSRSTYRPDYSPDIAGLVYYSLDIYYGLLNCGLRLAPTAGSASGVLPNPVGYNRVYVHTGSSFSLKSWFENLKAGRCFATNGPLLFFKVNNREPGDNIRKDSPFKASIDIEIYSRTTPEYVELVQNGYVVDRFFPEPGSKPFYYKIEGSRDIKESSWLAVRCFEKVTPQKIKYAHTAPIYIDIKDKPLPIDRRAVTFFIERVEALIEEAETGRAVHRSDERFYKGFLQNIGFENEADKQATLAIYKKALSFYQGLLDRN